MRLMLAREGVRVRVLRQLEVQTDSSEVLVEPGIHDASFLCQMIGHESYRQAYADGHLIILHEGHP